MKANKLIGKGVGRLGGGTDGMTTTDAILGSQFLNMTPLGLINGFGGRKTRTLNRDYTLDAATNGSYNGFLAAEDDAAALSNKKYGLLSRGAMHKANKKIDEINLQKANVSTIVDANQVNSLAA